MKMPRAVYYKRVSTTLEMQLEASKDQGTEAEDTIKENGWIFAGAYIDEGITGTRADKRDDYLRLLDDMELDKFDIIVIKSQDRLMRNTKDWYLFLEKLVTFDKKLYMYLERKFYTPDDALITGIKAILAEEYSRELSKKQNNAHRTRRSKGKPIITSATWGYDNINKKIVINEKEAEIVRLIYQMCADGYGSRSIVHELTNRGIRNRRGGEFEPVVCRRIIRNALYKGTAVMNVRSFDFNSKKIINNPESEWVYVQNAVEPIVDEELWSRANKEMDKRAKACQTDKNHKHLIGVNKGNYELSSKIVCGLCGNVYWRRRRRTSKGNVTVYWSCREYVRNGRKKIQDTRGKNMIKVKQNEEKGCDNIHLKDEELQQILSEIAKEIFGGAKENTVNTVLNLFKNVDKRDNIQAQLKKIKQEKYKLEHQRDLLLDKLLDETISNELYKKKDGEIQNKLMQVEEREQDILLRLNEKKSWDQKLEEIRALLNEKIADAACLKALTEHIKQIIVFPDQFEIYFDYMDNIRFDIESKKTYLYVYTGKDLTSIND